MDLTSLLYLVPAILIALTVHEFAHAFVAYKFGDISQKENGRLSLNPIHHLDPIGTLCLLLFQFGWAKPVKVNPYYFKNFKDGMIWTAVSGPIANFIVGFLSIVGYLLVLKFFTLQKVTLYLIFFFQYCALVNVGLGIFNLIPIPPLDGAKVLMGILPENMYVNLLKYEHVISILLLLCLGMGILDAPLLNARSVIIEAFTTVAQMIVH